MISKNDIAKIQNKIFIFDGHNLIYKSYFALPKLYDQKSRPTGAIQGTCNILLKFLLKYPDSMFCIASDSAGKNFRHNLYSEYKANRAQIDDELRDQIILMQDLYRSIGLNVISGSGFEADDYIASFVKKFSNEYKIFIISSDKDLMSLISENVFMIDPVKEDIFDEVAVEEKFGIRPKLIPDYLSLTGDSSDNIPGVPGIGPKTAIKILSYGTLDNLIQGNFDNIKDKKLSDKLKNNIDNLLMSKNLVYMKDDIDINITTEEMIFILKKNVKNIYDSFLDFNLNALALRIEKFLSHEEINEIKTNNLKQLNDLYKTYNDLNSEFLNEIYLVGECFISYEIDEKNIENFKIRILCEKNLFIFDNNKKDRNFIENFKKLLIDSSIKKITYNISYGLKNILRYFDIKNFSSIFDLSWIYFYLIGVRANENFQYIIKYINNEIEINNDLNRIKENHIFLYKDIFEYGLQKLINTKQFNHFEIDRNLYQILFEMENNGISLDKIKLLNLENKINNEMILIKEKIIDEIGYDFNIISPKQTSEVLFEKLNITPVGKKSTKTNLYSTDTAVLEELEYRGEFIASYILEYRSLNKLKTSYCTSLIPKVNSKTNKIHTSFWINGATTGRILSSDPNLQNIPTKSQIGREVRGCFCSDSDEFVLLSIDYSQIELRLLAKIANIKNLLDAFEKNIDIHIKTASEIFSIDIKDVSDSERSKAKAINFGIIYGISPFGLSKQLKISVNEASSIIKKYLLKYPEIEKYLDDTKKFFYENGYVETIFKKRCYAPQASQSSNYEDSFSIDERSSFKQNQFIERAVINARIQGSAADILKEAIISCKNMILNEFDEEKYKIILQIHDEIIFQIPLKNAEIFAQRASIAMESIFEGLKTKYSYSRYWDE